MNAILKGQVYSFVASRQMVGDETTFLHVKKKFKLTYAQVEEYCGSSNNMFVNTGICTDSGDIAPLPKKDWTVEILKDGI